MYVFRQPEANTGPVMMTFKHFLNSQSDDIEEMEAVRKYQEYKLDFRKTQIAEFFTNHKDEEWYVYEGFFLSIWCFILQHWLLTFELRK